MKLELERVDNNIVIVLPAELALQLG